MKGFSLRAKLTLALLTVGIASSMLVGIVAREILLRRFDEIQLNESFGRFSDDVVDYFQTFGTWDNGAEHQAFGQFSRQRNAQLNQAAGRGGPPPDDIERPIGRPGRGRGARPSEEEQPPFRFLLLDPRTDRVLLGPDEYQQGKPVPGSIRATARPITVNGKVVANAIPLRQPNFNAFDQGYLGAMQNAMIYGVAAASLLAIPLGLIIGARLSHRITRVTAAIAAMSQGDLYQRVEEDAGDEVGTMARVFNQMSKELYESRERIEQQTVMLRELSIRDELTGLHNRRHFDEQAATAFAHARRYNRPLTAMMCDIDHFKRINDTFTHAIGDDVLRRVAKILQANTRSSDIVARYGGEEFAIIFTESQPAEAFTLAERIRERMEAHDWSEVERGLRVTISVGLDSDMSRASAAAMLAAADERLYEAKHGGRNRVVAQLGT
jgi:two-component system cell cycle response regulator